MPAMICPDGRLLANQTINKDELLVRRLHLPADGEGVEELSQYLSSSERERAARYRRRSDYVRFVAARAWLRLQLSSLLHCNPETIQLCFTDYGKPWISGCDIEFNLSHSGEWVFFAFTSDRAVGIDIEKHRPIQEMRDVARHHFAPSEFAEWENMLEADRTNAFYRCWTRKESFIKAVGEGLSFPLNSFEVTLHPPARVISIRGSHSAATNWWIADLPASSGYTAAVVVNNRVRGPVRVSMDELSFVAGEYPLIRRVGE